MRKYMAVARTLFKSQIVYRFDVAATGLAVIGRVVFAWILWGVIFAQRAYVGGFTLSGMLSYSVVASFLTALDMSSGVSGEVSERIRDGTFSRFMVVPTNPQLHMLAQTLGSVAYYSIYSGIAAALSVVIFRIPLTLTAAPADIAAAIVMVVLGRVFMVSYHFFIGILAFRFLDIDFVLHVQGSILSFLTGAVIPLALLPAPALAALRFLPFPYVTYAPAMLLNGQGSGAGLGIAVLAIWTAAMLLIAQAAYQRLRVRFDGVGI